MACQGLFARPPTTHLYVFIDESGDFNFSPKGSQFYMFTALWTYAPICVASELITYRYSLLHAGVVNKWAAGWEQQGWRRKSDPIANLELVKEPWAQKQAHPRVRVQWVRAHDGSRWNEYADALANSYLR